MRSRTPASYRDWKFVGSLLLTVMLLRFWNSLHAAPQSKQAGAPSTQKAFATPEQAAQALIQAAETLRCACSAGDSRTGCQGSCVLGRSCCRTKTVAYCIRCVGSRKTIDHSRSEESGPRQLYRLGMTIGRFRFRS